MILLPPHLPPPSFVLFELERDGADSNGHADTDLDGNLSAVVGEPDIQVSRALVEDPIKEVDFVAEGVKDAFGGFDVFALLGFHTGSHALLAVADGHLRALAGLEVEGAEVEEAADDIVYARGDISFLGTQSCVLDEVALQVAGAARPAVEGDAGFALPVPLTGVE